jgi:hypothetical protein
MPFENQLRAGPVGAAEEGTVFSSPLEAKVRYGPI